MAETIITNAWISRLADTYRNGGDVDIAFVKWGEGGWTDPGSGQVRIAPKPTLTDLDCVVFPGNYPADSRFTFQKSISRSRITFPAAGQIRVECILDTGDANDDGNGDAPEFWELGLFASDGTMISHTTFDLLAKSELVVARAVVLLTISRPT